MSTPGLLRRIANPGVVVMLLGGVAMIVLASHTWRTSSDGERLAAQHERAGLVAAVQLERRVLESSLGAIGEAGRGMVAVGVGAPDLGEVMAGLAGREGIDLALLLGPNDHLLHAWRHGRRLSTGGFQGPAERLAALAARARLDAGRAASGIVATPFGPALAAAVTADRPGEAEARAARGTVAMVLRALDDMLLRALEERLLLGGLERAQGPAPPRSLRLDDVSGEPVVWLRWTSGAPYARLLAWLRPSLVAIVLLFVAGGVVAVMTLRRAATALRASETRFRDIAEVASDWIFELDRDLRLTFVSSGPQKGEGRSRAPSLGRHVAELIADDERGWKSRYLAAMAERRPISDMLVRSSGHRDAAGQRVLRISAVPVSEAGGGFAGYRGAARDVTAELETQARAEFLAYHDQVTGLPNRAMLARRGAALIDGEAGLGLPCAAVLALDLDRFKSVNDTLGHAAGDALLIECAQRLRATLGPEDFVARVGGDEFVALHLLGDGGPEAVAVLCEDLVRALGRPYVLDGRRAVVGVSIGVAMLTPATEPLDAVLQKADTALYRAKSTGRSQVRFHEPGMEVALRQRRQMEQDLREAVASDALYLHYQPKFDIAGRRISGVEALLRWTHPARGPVSPELFVPLAEEIGLMDEIGARVLQRACRDAAQWRGLPVAVNLSPVQFRRTELVGAVRRAIAEADLPHGCLELEVTENLLLSDQDGLSETLKELRGLGARMTMDDFGKGYSSLGYLQRFRFDKIKIDRQFVARLGLEDSAEAIVRAIIAMGKSLGIAVCAEGVEQQTQLDLLAQLGCEEAQGFLLGRPMPAEEVAALLDRRPQLELVADTARRA